MGINGELGRGGQRIVELDRILDGLGAMSPVVRVMMVAVRDLSNKSAINLVVDEWLLGDCRLLNI